MSVKLDWQVGDEKEKGPEPNRRRWGIGSVIVLIAAALVVFLFFSARDASNNRVEQAEARLRAAVQEAIDAEREAFLAGDGERFFANQFRGPAWISAQLRPENQAFYRLPLTVTRVEQDGDDVLASVNWSEDGEIRQRVLFFRWRGDQLIHFPSALDFWGPTLSLNALWGELHLHETDRQWGDEIVAFVNEVMADTCENRPGGNCLPNKLPLSLTVAADYRVTAIPNELRVPSPRLLALDEEGEPAEPFWDRLRKEIVAYMTPAQIRFAVPADTNNPTELLDYQKLARQFSENRPDINVEIVSLDQLPADPLIWPAEIDGAARTPTEAMLAAGLAFDLTDYVEDDPDFDRADFYEQVWRGAWWEDRMWLMPQAGSLKLIFYDRDAYGQANLDEPSLRWTWEEMSADAAALKAARLDNRSLSTQVIFMDISLDTLYSLAYSRDESCSDTATLFCPRQLRPDGMAYALSWYKSWVGQDGLMPDLANLSETERARMLFNFNAAIWTDEPLHYEHFLLLRPIGVVPFPGSEGFDGITPLRVEGSFVSHSSQNPRATWEWLKHLSYQHISRQRRLVPARPSVALSSGFWTTLPQPLSEAMQAAFPFAQAIRIADQAYFDWPQLAAVIEGQLATEDVEPSRPHWFAAEHLTEG